MSAEINGADAQTVRGNKLDLLERFADDLAHEIKNPLHSMVINLEVLKRRITREGGSTPDELMRYAGILASELDRVNRRIEVLLRLVRSDRTEELTSVPQTVDELMELLELERERRRVQITFEPSPVHVRAHIPRDSARQIVLNLVLYMLDVLAPGGRLTLRTEVEPEWIHLTLEGEGELAPNGGPGTTDGASHLGMARSIAEACGGQLNSVDFQEPRQISVSLPLNPA